MFKSSPKTNPLTIQTHEYCEIHIHSALPPSPSNPPPPNGGIWGSLGGFVLNFLLLAALVAFVAGVAGQP